MIWNYLAQDKASVTMVFLRNFPVQRQSKCMWRDEQFPSCAQNSDMMMLSLTLKAPTRRRDTQLGTVRQLHCGK
jgi:hypothetical protein